jgi:hypothetical protein
MNLMDPNPFDPANSIRRNRVAHMGSDRLVMRSRNFSVRNSSGGRMGFAMRAAELEAIHVELIRRHGPAVLQLVPADNIHSLPRLLELAAA